MIPAQNFLAYGASIAAPLDLGAWLVEGSHGRLSLQLLEIEDSQLAAELANEAPLNTSHGRQIAIRTDRQLDLSVPGQPWCFEVGEVVRFHWVGGEGQVALERLESCTDTLLAFWLIHIFLPLYLTLEGLYEIIHASAVEVKGATILFTAPSHGGKSTLTDFFLQQGHTLVSDDKVATFCEDGRYYAMPSHPNHRPYRKFEDLGYRVRDFSPQPRPIDVIYTLRATDSADKVSIEEVSGHEKFAALRPSYLFEFQFMQERRLRYLAELLNSVPAYRVGVPWDLERLGEVHDVLMRNCFL